jgi:regulator of protease activity HflC (stomatin/prohibitin superfamily)
MNSNRLPVRFFLYLGFAVIAIVLLISVFPVVIVGAGERGVIFNNFSGVENRILNEGLHIKIPFVQSVTKVSVRTQKTDIKAEAASKDLQTVNTDIVVNWRLDAGQVNTVYQQIGDQSVVADRIIIPAVNEVVKAATAQKTASEVLGRRAELKTDVDTLLSERLKKFNIILEDVSIVNVSFSPEFNRAIEQKQVAQQEAERALFRTQEASAEAQSTINRARGEAEANRLKQQSLSNELLELRAIEKWDGKLPQVTSGATPFINLNP